MSKENGLACEAGRIRRRSIWGARSSQLRDLLVTGASPALMPICGGGPQREHALEQEGEGEVVQADRRVTRKKMEGSVRVGEVGVERIDDGQTWAGELVGVDCRLGKCPSPAPTAASKEDDCSGSGGAITRQPACGRGDGHRAGAHVRRLPSRRRPPSSRAAGRQRREQISRKETVGLGEGAGSNSPRRRPPRRLLSMAQIPTRSSAGGGSGHATAAR
jgi:hypothetical protein